MKRLAILGILAVAACSGPTEPTPEPVVVWAADFENGKRPAWEYYDCESSIESDGGRYLLMTARLSAKSTQGFGAIYRPMLREGEPPRVFDISAKYKTPGIKTPGRAYIMPEGYWRQYMGMYATETWRYVTFQARLEASNHSGNWPSYYRIWVIDFPEYAEGMSLAVDDIKVVAVY